MYFYIEFQEEMGPSPHTHGKKERKKGKKENIHSIVKFLTGRELHM
jgi:hypothetical protein